MYKLKAAHDRTYRIDNGLYHDMEWGRGKLVKDYADIIALLDPGKGGRDIDLYYLGDKLKEWNFLYEHLAGIPGQTESIDRYGKMGQRDVKDMIDKSLTLL